LCFFKEGREVLIVKSRWLEVLISSGDWEAQKLRKYSFLSVKLGPFPFNKTGGESKKRRRRRRERDY
jgi:hypothetical protein